MQHHDAISGTERQHVQDDYMQRISEGIDGTLVSDDSGSSISFSVDLIGSDQSSLCQTVTSAKPINTYFSSVSLSVVEYQ